MLRREAVQPAEPVGAGDVQDTTRTTIDPAACGDERALLGKGVTEMRRCIVIRRVGRNRARAAQ
jgi:hypothetical protein